MSWRPPPFWIRLKEIAPVVFKHDLAVKPRVGVRANTPVGPQWAGQRKPEFTDPELLPYPRFFEGWVALIRNAVSVSYPASVRLRFKIHVQPTSHAVATHGTQLIIGNQVSRVISVGARPRTARNYILDNAIAEDDVKDSAEVESAARAVLGVPKCYHKPGWIANVVAAPPDSVAHNVPVLPRVAVLEPNAPPHEQPVARALFFSCQHDRAYLGGGRNALVFE